MNEMNSNSKITFSEEQYKLLLEVFTKLTINEHTSINSVMLNTGEQRVLEYIKSRVGFTMRRNIRD